MKPSQVTWMLSNALQVGSQPAATSATSETSFWSSAESAAALLCKILAIREHGMGECLPFRLEIPSEMLKSMSCLHALATGKNSQTSAFL